MATDVADLVATLRLDTQKFQAGIDQATASTQTLGRAVTANLTPATAATAKLSDAMGALPGPLAAVTRGFQAMGGPLAAAQVGLTAVTAATVGVATSLFLMAQSAAQAGDALGQARTQTGASAEALSALAVAAERTGHGLTDVVALLTTMAQRLDVAGTGGQAALAALDRLGVSLQTLQAMQPDAQLEALAKALTALPNATDRSALALQLFGERGAALMPVLQQLAEQGIGGLTTKAAELGRLFSSEGVQTARAYQDAIHALTAAQTGLAQTIGLAILPSLTTMVELFAAGAKAAVEFERSTHLILTVLAEVGSVALGTIGLLMGSGGLVAALRFIGIEGLSAAAGLEATKPAAEAAATGLMGATTAAESAAKAFKALESSLAPALDAVKGLGPEFADLATKLEVLQAGFTNLKAIDALKKLRDEGEITAAEFERAFAAIDAKMRALETGALSVAPAVEAIGEAATDAGQATVAAMEPAITQVTQLGSAAETTAQMVERLFGIGGGPLLDTLTMLIDAGRAAEASLEGAAGAAEDLARASAGSGGDARYTTSVSGGGSPAIVRRDSPLGVASGYAFSRGAPRYVTPEEFNSTTVYGGGGTTRKGSGGGGSGTFRPQTEYIQGGPGYSPSEEYVNSFQHGGIVPGPVGQPQLAVVHGGEIVVPADAMTTAGGVGGSSAMPWGREHAAPTVVVNLNGMTVLQSREALTELAFAVADIVADQTRRTRR